MSPQPLSAWSYVLLRNGALICTWWVLPATPAIHTPCLACMRARVCVIACACVCAHTHARTHARTHVCAHARMHGHSTRTPCTTRAPLCTPALSTTPPGTRSAPRWASTTSACSPATGCLATGRSQVCAVCACTRWVRCQLQGVWEALVVAQGARTRNTPHPSLNPHYTRPGLPPCLAAPLLMSSAQFAIQMCLAKAVILSRCGAWLFTLWCVGHPTQDCALRACPPRPPGWFTHVPEAAPPWPGWPQE